MSPLNFVLPTIPTPTKLEAAMRAFPLFGGEGEESTTTTTTEKPAGSAATTTTSSTAGGSTTSTVTPDQIANDPTQIANLLSQIEKNAADLKAAQTQLDTYKNKEETAQRATQTREQNLQKDLEKAETTIAQMDAVIRHSAIMNAIQSMTDYEFHSARHVINELQDDEFDVDVDLEKGVATVTGMEAAIKRIAAKEPWLIKKKETTDGTTQQTTRVVKPATGAPPVGGSGAGNGASRRADLMKRFPVIAQGRRT